MKLFALFVLGSIAICASVFVFNMYLGPAHFMWSLLCLYAAAEIYKAFKRYLYDRDYCNLYIPKGWEFDCDKRHIEDEGDRKRVVFTCTGWQTNGDETAWGDANTYVYLRKRKVK